MLRDPLGQCVSFELPGGEPQHDLLLLIHCRTKLMPIQQQEYLHGCVAGSFVAVDEGMI